MSEEKSGLTSQQTMAFMKGEPLESGNYKMVYNVDGENRYYLIYTGEDHSWSYSFVDVEYVGEGSYLLGDRMCKNLSIDNLQNYEVIEKALITILDYNSD